MSLTTLLKKKGHNFNGLQPGGFLKTWSPPLTVEMEELSTPKERESVQSCDGARVGTR